jgi:hypothetical protein
VRARRVLPALGLLAAGLGAPLPLRAATAPPAPPPAAAPAWAGMWRLDVAGSAMGRGPRVPRWREDRVAEDGAWLAVEMTSVRASGDTVRLAYRYRTDGEAVNRMLGQDIRTRGRLEDGALLFESETQLALFKFEVRERWTLSADGAAMTQERTSRSPLGEERQRLLFRRVRGR